jgi:hypothetical protein
MLTSRWAPRTTAISLLRRAFDAPWFHCRGIFAMRYRLLPPRNGFADQRRRGERDLRGPGTRPGFAAERCNRRVRRLVEGRDAVEPLDDPLAN